ncbi:hypothetical protein DVK02_03185 [Halobellus sp. Atlit-31R]|nr:hypothetical protein DVK02_03185 [Halobellus sp. Atlit-31R]
MVTTELPEIVEFERHGGVGVWEVMDASEFFLDDEARETGESHYERVAGGVDIHATVVAVHNAEGLGQSMSEFIEHVGDKWSKLADAADTDKLAYVGEGIAGSMVSTKIDADAEIKSFNVTADAIEWCQE